MLVPTFSCSCQNIKKETLRQILKFYQIIFLTAILFTEFFATTAIDYKVLSSLSK